MIEDEEEVTKVYDLAHNVLKCTCGHDKFVFHPTGREETYVCEECGKGYLNPSNLLHANEHLYRDEDE